MKEIINFVPYFIIIFIYTIIYNLCYAKLNNRNIKINKKNLIIMLGIAILMAINNLYNNIELKTLTMLVIGCIDFRLIFKDDIKKIVLSYTIIFAFIIILEIIITNLLCLIGILNNSIPMESITYIKLGLSILVGTIEFGILSFKKMNKLVNKLFDLFLNKINTLSIAYLLFLTVSLLGILNVRNYANSNSIQLILLLTIIFVILFIFIIQAKYHEEVLKVSNRKLIDYNNNYGKFLDDYKIYKHNINHKLVAMKSFGNKKINALIDDLLEEETTFSIKNNELYNIPNGIKGIVAEKLYNKDYHVMIDNKIKKDPFIKLDARSFNSISECIGIALDNAVEASEATEEPIILLDLNEDNENIYLKIGNNYCNNIDLDSIGNKYYSTKNRGSGLGLFSIKQNNLVKEKIEIINNFYYIELQIKKAR